MSINESDILILAAGDHLFAEGDAGEAAFIIEDGCIEVRRETDYGGEVLARLGAGELIGEMSLIDRMPRSASAVAAAPSRLWRLTRAMYEDRYRASDPLMRLLLRALLHRHRTSLRNPDDRPHSHQATMQIDREQLLRRLTIEAEMRAALRARQFVLHFQPIVRVSDMRTAGFEALLRWQHPGRGMVPPGEFIPIAEESDLIVELGSWILEEGCAALSRLRRAQLRLRPESSLFLTVNVAGRQFESGMLAAQVSSAASAVPLDGAVLKLEVTETQLMRSPEVTHDVVKGLHAIGVQLAIDDFGTGYSSLNYLHHLDAQCLKVDRSFVRCVDDRTRSADCRVLKAIAALATTFRLETVVEGVETASQFGTLREIGFDYMQGFLFSRALGEGDAAALLQRDWSEVV